MKENQKDLLMLCIATFGITYVHLWCLILPYYASYCYMKDNTIRVNQIYGTYLFYLIGQLFASATIPYLFKIFGISLMYLFFSLVEIFMGFFSVYYIQPLQVCAVLLFKGYLFQAVQTAGNIILTQKFEGGILKGKYLNTSRLCFSFLWLFLAQMIMNPESLPQDLKSEHGEFFFHENVAKNFAFYTLSYSLSSAIFLLMPFFFVTNPQNFQNNFVKFLKYLFGKSEFEFNIEDDKLAISHVSESQIYIEQKEKNEFIERSINKSLSVKSENLLEENKKNGIPNNIVNYFGLIIMLNLCITYYTVDNYKYISLVLEFKDFYITIIYFFSNLFYIISNYIVTYIWNKYGFDSSLLILNVINAFNLIGILFSKNFFLFQILFARAGFGWLLLLQDLFCYSMFDAFEAMKKTKTMIFYAFLGDLIQVLLNFAIFKEDNYKLIFFALFLLNLTSFTIHGKLLYKKNCYKGDLYCARCAGSQCQKCFDTFPSSNGCSKPSLEIDQCISYKSSNHCQECQFGFKVNEQGRCETTGITNCLQENINQNCRLCNYSKLVKEDGTCPDESDSDEECELYQCDICERQLEKQRCYLCAPGLVLYTFMNSDNEYEEQCVFQNAGTQNCRKTYHNSKFICQECQLNYYMEYGKCIKNNDLNFTLDYKAYNIIVKLSLFLIALIN